MWVLSVIIGLFKVSNQWRGTQYISHKYGGHDEMDSSYDFHSI
jgi:hypothetical protein